ncbi:hypothetical protein ACUTAH_02410 [Metapseudomonas furukawaii]|uniref:hypothetical protein n=1 Tax=Metapseudomonas furukawaii TaxID=1149133 RepID=UPI0040455880
MNTARTLLPLALAVMAGLSAGFVLAETPSSPVTTSLEADLLDPVKQAAYLKEAQALLVCVEPADAKAKAAAFAELTVAKWDRQQMGCGVRHGFELAQAQPDNVELQLQALGAQVEYFDVLDKGYGRLYSESPVKDIELRLRWNETREHAEILLERLQPLAGQVAEVLALRGVYRLASVLRETPESDKMQAPALALPDLEAAIKLKPEVLDGGGLLMLGSVLLRLPEFAGGDTELAIELLSQGNRLAPQNLQLKVALLDALLGERENAKAIAVLQEAAKIGADGQNPQDYADALRTLGGQAVRLQQMGLAKQLAGTRDAYLQAHPYLNQRKSTATAGHGGVDPLTGEDPDKIQ